MKVPGVNPMRGYEANYKFVVTGGANCEEDEVAAWKKNEAKAAEHEEKKKTGAVGGSTAGSKGIR